jgi:sugar/nucleoside kinase (ribokinase family)
MQKKYNLYGIGNALVDMEFEVTDEFFKQHKIDKGLMTLVDEERQNLLLASLGDVPLKQQCGGSAANTVIANAQFGGKSYYSCKVASDTVGNFYYQDLQDKMVDSNLLHQKHEHGITGKCLVLVTPDAERTMNTFLGITSTLDKDQVDPEAIRNSQYVYMEGYLVASSSGKAAAIHAREIAEQSGVKTALTFSDVNMVKYFREGLQQMIGKKLDLIFCNAAEALAFTETHDLIVARERLKDVARSFVITLGENGAMIYDGKSFIDVSPYKIKAIDSNGAGDMFAGAFLYAISHGHSHAVAGRLAAFSASRVVSQFGPRLKWQAVQEIKKEILGGSYE